MTFSGLLGAGRMGRFSFRGALPIRNAGARNPDLYGILVSYILYTYLQKYLILRTPSEATVMPTNNRGPRHIVEKFAHEKAYGGPATR